MNIEKIVSELNFKAVRSGGAGGQHVNKVSSKVVLFFNLNTSEGLSDLEKERLRNSMSSKLNSDYILILNCDETRSQHRNKELVVSRFLEILKNGLKVKKTRRPTKVPRSVVKKRMESKKKQSDKKSNRKKPLKDL